MDEFFKWWPVIAMVVAGLTAFVWFIVRRLIDAVDKLDEQVMGPDGPVAWNRVQIEAVKVNYLTRAEFNSEMEKVSTAIDRMRLEGIGRETRILESVERINTSNREQTERLREAIKTDIGGVHTRIDRLIQNGHARD